MELWKRQLIRYLFHYSGHRLRIEEAFVVKHPHVPGKLYKYRQFSSHHFDALERGVLWMCSPDRFNDPYDAAVSFDPDGFLVEDYTPEEFLQVGEERQKLVASGARWRPKPLVKPVRAGEWRDKAVRQLLKRIHLCGKEKLVPFLEEIMAREHEKIVAMSARGLRESFGVLSISEDCKSTLMWSHYSDSHKGFCIEYDFSALEYADLRKRLCFPVFYTRKLRNATRYMARKDPSDFNNLFGQFMCLVKDAQWSYEREWRIVHALGPKRANKEIVMPVPSAILLGADATLLDEEKMKRFCALHGIPLKKMVLPVGRFGMDVVEAQL